MLLGLTYQLMRFITDLVLVRTRSDTQRWSSGPVAGQVNRLKMLKRQMLGRANFDLLRRRVLGTT